MAYTIDSLVTQLDGDEAVWDAARRQPQPGVPTSSSSDPGLMATMLEALEACDDHKILEIGTGTGYQAALMCQRLSDTQVTSIEIDAGLADTARGRIAELGHAPTIVAGDGAAGVPDRAPFDRIIATVAAPGVPNAWLAQTRPGGKILLNLYSQLGGGALLLLTVAGPRHAEGHFLESYGGFMPLRTAQPMGSDQQRFHAALRAAAVTGPRPPYRPRRSAIPMPECSSVCSSHAPPGVASLRTAETNNCGCWPTTNPGPNVTPTVSRSPAHGASGTR